MNLQRFDAATYHEGVAVATQGGDMDGSQAASVAEV